MTSNVQLLYLELKHLAPSRAVRCAASSEADCRRTMSAELKKACERRSDRRKRFPLGLGDGETVTQVPKKKWVCLSLNIKEATFRQLGKKVCTEEYETTTKWAVTNFLAWQTGRNKMFDGDQAKQVPTTLLQSTDPSILSKWFSLYCAEARKKVDRTRTDIHTDLE